MDVPLQAVWYLAPLIVPDHSPSTMGSGQERGPTQLRAGAEIAGSVIGTKFGKVV